MKKEYTNRGFIRYNFKDSHGEECSIQESSSAIEKAIWLGIDNPSLTVFEDENTGKYMEIKMPKQFNVSSRMHLNKEQVKMLLPILQKFIKIGEI